MARIKITNWSSTETVGCDPAVETHKRRTVVVSLVDERMTVASLLDFAEAVRRASVPMNVVVSPQNHDGRLTGLIVDFEVDLGEEPS
jgi:hypothetical protein